MKNVIPKSDRGAASASAPSKDAVAFSNGSGYLAMMRDLFLQIVGGGLSMRAGDDQPAIPSDIRHVHLLDTAVASTNVGDEIIVEAALRHIGPSLENCYVSSSSSHDGLGPSGARLVEQADLVLFLGSNALSPHFHIGKPSIWHLKKADVPLLSGKLVLVGVGAKAHYKDVEPRQMRLLNRLLHKDLAHSVRDATAASIVRECGRTANNTSCPSLWQFADRVPVSPGKADGVTFTLTAHKPDPNDRAMIKILREEYRRLWFWPQQPRDLDYLRSLDCADGVEIIAPNLAAYDTHLHEHETDVVGTRLHGTIRGLHFGRRIIVISIDNRAEDISREVGLPAVGRSRIGSELGERLRNPEEVSLSLPADNIATFTRGLRDFVRV